MRSMAYESLVEASAELCEETLFLLRDDIAQAIEAASLKEEESGRTYLELLLQNAKLAQRDQLPLTQDPGIPLFLVSVGDELALETGTIRSAIEDGMRDVQKRYPFPVWSSQQPFGDRPDLRDRVTPHIYLTTHAGDELRLQCVRLDRMSEGASQIIQLAMPLQLATLREALVDCVKRAATVAAPPYIVGIGVGGAFAEVGMLAQQALLRPIGKPHQELDFARIEQDLLASINELELGPGGLGGHTTALAVHVETAPTHSETVPVCFYLQTPGMRAGEKTL